MGHIITPTFRVSYPKVFTPELNKLSDKMEYSVVALFKKGESLKILEEAMLKALREKHGDQATFVKMPPSTICSGYGFIAAPGKAPQPCKNWPLRDQGDREKEDGMPPGYEKGAIMLNLKSKNKPGLVDENKQDIIEDSFFYAGCYARAAVNAYYYDQAGNKGVSFGLQAIQKVKDGEAFGIRVDPQTAFEPIAQEESVDASSLFGTGN